MIDMSTLIRTALAALMIISGASAGIAAPARDSGFTDMSQPYGGYDPNSPQGNRAFWDYQSRQGN
jgi:hypothetical protein